MSPRRAPTLRDLHDSPYALRRAPAPTRRHIQALIEDDPDLAPPPRAETPLSAWA